MDLIADILLAAGALGAGFYCFVLSRRLNKFNNLEKGVGGAVAVLSSQVDDLNKSLKEAQAISNGSSQELKQLTGRAETVAQRLELMMASMHDLPTVDAAPAAPSPQADEDTDALAAAYEAEVPEQVATPPAPVPEPEPEEAKPAGLMFVRHNRNKVA